MSTKIVAVSKITSTPMTMIGRMFIFLPPSAGSRGNGLPGTGMNGRDGGGAKGGIGSCAAAGVQGRGGIVATPTPARILFG